MIVRAGLEQKRSIRRSMGCHVAATHADIMPRFLRVGARLLRSRHRRGSTLYLKYKRIIDKKAIRRANRRELQQDLVKWIKLGDHRSRYYGPSRGESWEQQAKSQKHH